ncbi:DUF302 domain-containing protein [Lutibaculum baratangense]|uniref:Uncharacterized protein n=1 Tax=Lutibaculum baratangense AMV1 TaxID=631454 RepID=V4RMK4_9HYPH|nr:DUF302 domain-containing protein [Lutibaculum baratangense]ESR27261.1 hypothetical protein N177_0240 [Lutibaculum baratangense AMV1]
MNRKIGAVLAAPCLLFLACGTAIAQSGGITTHEVEAPFDQVRQDIYDAIVNRGYVIDYNARIGEMLERTGQDVGSDRSIFSGAETFQFCSAVLSRKTMEADPLNIAYCPYTVFVFEAAEREGVVTVGFRHLGDGGEGDGAEALDEVNQILDEIVREAAGQP